MYIALCLRACASTSVRNYVHYRLLLLFRHVACLGLAVYISLATSMTSFCF